VAPSKNTEREVREARDRLRRYNARQAVHAHQVKRRRRDNIIGLIVVVVVAGLATTSQVSYFTTGPGTPKPTASATPTATPGATPSAGANVGDVPSPSVAQARTWTGTMTLNKVALGISFDGKAAPQAVASFVTDAKKGYFTGKTCHRLVVSSSAGLLQCGSLTGTGASDPNYSFGPIENAPANGVYPAGTIAVARAADNAYSQGHQFFIVFKSTTIPDDTAGGYTVLGKVTSGLDQLIAKIADGGVTPSATSTTDGAPKVPTTITSFTIQ
jgi:peptidyl-prolyl cis-trans isomerase B (cyclophilin B)